MRFWYLTQTENWDRGLTAKHVLSTLAGPTVQNIPKMRYSSVHRQTCHHEMDDKQKIVCEVII